MNDDPRDEQNGKPLSGDEQHAGPDAGESRNSRPDRDEMPRPESYGGPGTGAESGGERPPLRRSYPAEPIRTPEDARLTGIGGWLITYIVFQALNILSFLNNLRGDDGSDELAQFDPLAAAELDRLNGLVFLLGALSVVGTIACLYLLFQQKRIAPRANRILLVAQSIFIVLAFLIMLEPLRQYLDDTQQTILLVGLALQILCNGLWFAYFGKSRRVALTFTE